MSALRYLKERKSKRSIMEKQPFHVARHAGSSSKGALPYDPPASEENSNESFSEPTANVEDSLDSFAVDSDSLPYAGMLNADNPIGSETIEEPKSPFEWDHPSLSPMSENECSLEGQVKSADQKALEHVNPNETTIGNGNVQMEDISDDDDDARNGKEKCDQLEDQNDNHEGKQEVCEHITAECDTGGRKDKFLLEIEEDQEEGHDQDESVHEAAGVGEEVDQVEDIVGDGDQDHLAEAVQKDQHGEGDQEDLGNDGHEAEGNEGLIDKDENGMGNQGGAVGEDNHELAEEGEDNQEIAEDGEDNRKLAEEGDQEDLIDEVDQDCEDGVGDQDGVDEGEQDGVDEGEKDGVDEGDKDGVDEGDKDGVEGDQGEVSKGDQDVIDNGLQTDATDVAKQDNAVNKAGLEEDVEVEQDSTKLVGHGESKDKDSPIKNNETFQNKEQLLEDDEQGNMELAFTKDCANVGVEENKNADKEDLSSKLDEMDEEVKPLSEEREAQVTKEFEEDNLSKLGTSVRMSRRIKRNTEPLEHLNKQKRKQAKVVKKGNKKVEEGNSKRDKNISDKQSAQPELKAESENVECTKETVHEKSFDSKSTTHSLDNPEFIHFSDHLKEVSVQKLGISLNDIESSQKRKRQPRANEQLVTQKTRSLVKKSRINNEKVGVSNDQHEKCGMSDPEVSINATSEKKDCKGMNISDTTENDSNLTADVQPHLECDRGTAIISNKQTESYDPKESCTNIKDPFLSDMDFNQSMEPDLACSVIIKRLSLTSSLCNFLQHCSVALTPLPSSMVPAEGCYLQLPPDLIKKFKQRVSTMSKRVKRITKRKPAYIKRPAKMSTKKGTGAKLSTKKTSKIGTGAKRSTKKTIKIGTGAKRSTRKTSKIVEQPEPKYTGIRKVQSTTKPLRMTRKSTSPYRRSGRLER